MNRSVLFIALIASLAGCHRATQSYDAPQPSLVQAWASADSFASGDIVQLRCMAWKNDTERLDVPLDMQLPAELTVKSSSNFATTVSAERAGHYTVRCSHGDKHADVGVTVLPGPPQRLRVAMGRAAAHAGDKLQAQCLGEDAFGNDVEPPDATFQVTSGNTLSDDGLVLTRAGKTALSCRVPSWPNLAAAARTTIDVLPAQPKSVYGEVDTDFSPAHAEVGVRCYAVDAYGNVARIAEDFQVQGPGPVHQSASSFAADLSGRYTVHCVAGSLRDPHGTPIQVVAAAPARWEAELDNPRACYTQGKALPLQYRAWDAYGNRVQNLQVDLQATPPDGLSRDVNGGFVLANESDYSLVLSVRTPAAPGVTLEPYTWHIRVDSTPPALVINTPQRGAMLASDNATQAVDGFVRDKLSAITSLFIDGQPQALPEEALEVPFHAAVKREWGVNLVNAWATDSCGNAALLSQAYLSSPNFGPSTLEPAEDARIPHAVVARLSQALWDDNRRDTADDVATLLEKAIGDRSLVSYLPEPLWASKDENHDGLLDRVNYACRWLPWSAQDNRTTGYEIERAGPPTYDAPVVEYFRVVDGGWHVALVVRNLRVPVSLRAYYDAGCAGNPHVNLSATVVAPAFRLEFTAKPHFVDGQPRIRFEPTATHLTLPDGPPLLEADWGMLGRDSTWGVLGRLGVTKTLDGALNAWVQRYADLLQNVVDSELAQHLETLLQRLLQGVRLEHSLALPAPWRGGLAAYSGVDAVALAGPEGSGRGDLSLWAQLSPHGYGLTAPAGTTFLPPSQGPIRHPHMSEPDLQLGANQTFALALQDDLFNQLLWGLWYSGAFTVSDLMRLGVPGVACPTNPDAAKISLFFTLPPVLMPNPEANSVRLALGDVFVEADLDLHELLDDTGASPPPGHQRLHFAMYVSGVFDASITLDTEQRHLEVLPLASPRLHVQVVNVSDRAFQAVATHFVESTLNATLPKLLAASLGSFPLPALQVGVLPGVPTGTVWTLSNGLLSRPPQGTNTVLRGTLRGTKTN